jgi:hypothetical protein
MRPLGSLLAVTHLTAWQLDRNLQHTVGAMLTRRAGLLAGLLAVAQFTARGLDRSLELAVLALPGPRPGTLVVPLGQAQVAFVPAVLLATAFLAVAQFTARGLHWVFELSVPAFWGTRLLSRLFARLLARLLAVTHPTAWQPDRDLEHSTPAPAGTGLLLGMLARTRPLLGMLARARLLLGLAMGTTRLPADALPSARRLHGVLKLAVFTAT